VIHTVQDVYDRVAEQYTAEFRHELDRKPFDRKMLDWLIEQVHGLGPICDLGCGPGQVARYIYERGAEACGIDLSGEMVKQAAALNPGIRFQQGNMLALHQVASGTFGGIAAFYSIIHIPRDRVIKALQELKRVLRPQGVLLLAFHLGTETVHKDEWWGKPVSIDFLFYETWEMKANLRAAGFDVLEAIERDPYPEIEYQSRRAYIFARLR
jgi:SAM-dependent methyltransferase